MKRNSRKKIRYGRIAILIIILIIVIAGIITIFKHKKTVKTSTENTTTEPVQSNQENPDNKEDNKKNKINDWRLVLANYENILPEDFEIELANIDDTRQFDARAIKYLREMINDMRKDGITNIWVQSAYRSVQRQKELYDRSVKKYLNQGKTQEEAEIMTLEYINKPGASDHNLGLGVDFNNVSDDFEDLKAFKWLTENAENYGFVLRYPKDKENVTQIAYESWHWRYVGEEHAKKMNELHMCLEEYVEYLNK